MKKFQATEIISKRKCGMFFNILTMSNSQLPIYRKKYTIESNKYIKKYVFFSCPINSILILSKHAVSLTGRDIYDFLFQIYIII